jgi:hypothetical protein
MGKAEISWKTKNEEGVRREVYVHCVGNAWKFFEREKKFEDWQPLERPLLEDYLELLDGVQRRVARRLLEPDDEKRVRRMIREAYPDAKI